MNPFKYGCVVEGEYFCPRPTLERDLGKFVEAGQNVVVQGERRMGKTSLIKKTVGAIGGMRLLYVDLYCIRTLSDFCRRVMVGVGGTSERMPFLRKALSLANRLRPALSFDSITGSPSISVDVRAANEPDSLGVVMSMVRKLASEEKLCVVFDEFQDILDLQDSQSVLAEMRSTIQFQPDTPYLFSGSVRNEMMRIFDDSESPFFKSAVPFTVGAIDETDFARFIVARFEKGNRSIDESAAIELVRRADYVTGDVQQLCEAIWDSTESGAVVSSESVAAAFDLVFSREQEAYGAAVRSLTPLQVAVLRALAAKRKEEGIFSEAFMSNLGTSSTGALRTAMKRLIAKRLVYMHGDECKFTNPFFREWILRKM